MSKGRGEYWLVLVPFGDLRWKAVVASTLPQDIREADRLKPQTSTPTAASSLLPTRRCLWPFNAHTRTLSVQLSGARQSRRGAKPHRLAAHFSARSWPRPFPSRMKRPPVKGACSSVAKVMVAPESTANARSAKPLSKGCPSGRHTQHQKVVLDAQDQSSPADTRSEVSHMNGTFPVSPWQPRPPSRE